MVNNAYYPRTVDEAAGILFQKDEKKIICGGTDVMVRWKMENSKRGQKPALVFVNQIQEIQKITDTTTVLSIGAGTVYADILRDMRVPELLRQAVGQIASPAIRNAGTVAGNICNASPAGDTLPVLYLLDAQIVKISLDSSGKRCEKRMPVSDFILGVRKTALDTGEMVTAIELPKKSYADLSRTYYKKVGARNAQAISKVSFAALLKERNGIIQDIRVAFGAVGVTVVRKPDYEKKLAGIPVAELSERSRDFATLWEPYVQPIDDQRSTAVYRKKICMNMLEDFFRADDAGEHEDYYR
jgi:xanthine dehydrogenase FAD-binding subunit